MMESISDILAKSPVVIDNVRNYLLNFRVQDK